MSTDDVTTGEQAGTTPAGPAERFPQLAGLGLGAAQLGNLYRAMPDDQAQAIVDRAWELGVRYFDTAPHYGLGLSERRLGRALRRYPRDEYLISTKVGRLLRPNPNPGGRDSEGFDVPDDLVRVRDYSADGVRSSLEESLERLGLDRVDIAYIHDPDDHYDEALAGAVPELGRLREQGVIRGWGVGMNQAELLARFAADADPDLLMLAGRLTLLERPDETDLLPRCRSKGIGIVAVGVFNSGILAAELPATDAMYNYEPAPPELIERARRIAVVCERHGVSLPAAAVAYPRTEPGVVNVTLGMSSPGQVERNTALASVAVPPELWRALAEENLIENHTQDDERNER